MAGEDLVADAKMIAARSLHNLDVHSDMLGIRMGMMYRVAQGQYILHGHVPTTAASLTAALPALRESARHLGPLLRQENFLSTFHILDE